MSQACAEWHGEIGAYVVGALSPAEAGRVRRHLRGCAGCCGTCAAAPAAGPSTRISFRSVTGSAGWAPLTACPRARRWTGFRWNQPIRRATR